MVGGLVDVSFTYRMDKQQVLLYSTRNCIQYPVINHNGKECIYKTNVLKKKGNVCDCYTM